MKVYFIDRTGKNLRLKDKIMKNEIENIEVKDTYSFRSTKNDFVILSEYNPREEENKILEKYNNLIILTDKKDFETIWKLANEYKTIDIINSNLDEDYIANRIAKLVNRL